MKINHLLSEQELNELWGLAARSLGSLMRGSRTIPNVVSKVPVPKVPTAKKIEKVAKQEYKDSVWKKLGFSKDSQVGQWRIEQMKKTIQKRGIKAHNDAKINNMKAATAIQEKMANLGVSLFSKGFFLYGVYDYLMSRWALDPDDPDYEEQLNKLNGEFVMSWIMPKVVGVIGKVSSKTIAKMIEMTGFPRAGEVARRWLGHVARVGEVAAMAWFRTDKGKQWFAETFPTIMGLFNVAGYAVDAIVDLAGVGGQAVGAAAKTAADIARGDLNFDTKAKGDPYAGTWRQGMIK